MLTIVKQSIAELDKHATSQTKSKNAAREGVASKAAARETLIDDLEAISQTARALAFETPGLDNKFRLPRNVGDQNLIRSARAFSQDAEPLKALFIKSAMPVNFIENLNEDIQDLEEAIREHAASKENHLTATVGIEAAMDKALIAVRRLDPIINNTFRDNPVVMAAWQSARHVERPRSKPAPAAQSAAPTAHP